MTPEEKQRREAEIKKEKETIQNALDSIKTTTTTPSVLPPKFLDRDLLKAGQAAMENKKYIESVVGKAQSTMSDAEWNTKISECK